MSYFCFPTSADIYLEKNGERVATVQGYQVKTDSGKFKIKLTRVYGLNPFTDLIDLDNFDLVVKKREKEIRYTGCKIKETSEYGTIHGMALDVVRLVAKDRSEATHEK